MGVIQAFAGALGGTFADQWKDIITAGHFGEYTVGDVKRFLSERGVPVRL